MRSFHSVWAWAAVLSTGLVGLWGLVLAATKRDADRAFRIGWAVAYAAVTVQVAAGLVMWGRGDRPENEFHVFYGVTIVATFAFAYVYRAQMERRPALAYGVMLLFVMGLGLRAWSNVTL
jgi:tryptophan-rich sensory protein